jgi:hypothetical protein
MIHLRPRLDDESKKGLIDFGVVASGIGRAVPEDRSDFL